MEFFYLIFFGKKDGMISERGKKTPVDGPLLPIKNSIHVCNDCFLNSGGSECRHDDSIKAGKIG
ncbi:hypothetical protein N643_06225 [Salmonella bongori serovar 48:z41:-- str. RKS3044]|nr:hypothetical protein N643_06225 [Salmonella bongori serovar 48:z41:-- str. RKS3044]